MFSFVFIVAYHHERSSIREAYEERFAPGDAREVYEGVSVSPLSTI